MTAEFIPIISLHADPAVASGAGSGGGTHQYLRELLSGLALRGRRCVVLTRWSSPLQLQEQVLSAHARIVRLRIGDVAPLQKQLLNSRHSETVAAIRAALDALGEDVRVLHSVYWNSGRAAMDIARERNIPFVHSVISNGLRRIEEGAQDTADDRVAVERQVFAAAERIFSVSHDEFDDLTNRYGVDPARIVIVGRPVDPAFREPAHDERGRPRSPLAAFEEARGRAS